MDITDYIERKWWFGIPADFILQHAKEIGEMIEKHRLVAMDQSILATKPAVAMKAAAGTVKIPDHSIYGGIRVPHLHYKGNIYALNQEQWKEFSEIMLTKFRHKLEKTNTVNFEQLMDLSASIDKLP